MIEEASPSRPASELSFEMPLPQGDLPIESVVEHMSDGELACREAVINEFARLVEARVRIRALEDFVANSYDQFDVLELIKAFGGLNDIRRAAGLMETMRHWGAKETDS